MNAATIALLVLGRGSEFRLLNASSPFDIPTLPISAAVSRLSDGLTRFFVVGADQRVYEFSRPAGLRRLKFENCTQVTAFENHYLILAAHAAFLDGSRREVPLGGVTATNDARSGRIVALGTKYAYRILGKRFLESWRLPKAADITGLFCASLNGSKILYTALDGSLVLLESGHQTWSLPRDRAEDVNAVDMDERGRLALLMVDGDIYKLTSNTLFFTGSVPGASMLIRVNDHFLIGRADRVDVYTPNHIVSEGSPYGTNVVGLRRMLGGKFWLCSTLGGGIYLLGPNSR